MKRDYFEGADVAVTICAKDGPEPARSLLADMLENPRTNVYTVEKEGVKKLIFQTPWYDGDEYAGFMELSMVLPEVVPNRIRKPKV